MKWKKKFFSQPPKFRVGGVYEIFLAGNFLKKNFFFSFYSRYQNVRPVRLLKHVQNFIITKNKDTVKLNFCKIEYSFIVTEINHYCETTRGDINFWKASF